MPKIECFVRIGGLELPLKIVEQGGILRGDDVDLSTVVPNRIEIYLTEADRTKIRNALRGAESSISNQKS